jgi:hypothetical protein
VKGKRREHTADFKFKVALEALKGLRTLSELASAYEVHPTLINKWKKHLKEEGREILELHRFIKDNFIEFEEKKCPDFPAGALWFYKGFFPYRKMEPWKVDVSTGIIFYKEK